MFISRICLLGTPGSVAESSALHVDLRHRELVLKFFEGWRKNKKRKKCLLICSPGTLWTWGFCTADLHTWSFRETCKCKTKHVLWSWLFEITTPAFCSEHFIFSGIAGELGGSLQLSQNLEPFSPSWSTGSCPACPFLGSQPGDASQADGPGAGAADVLVVFFSLCQMEVSNADSPKAPDGVYPLDSNCGTWCSTSPPKRQALVSLGTVQMKSWESSGCTGWG